MAHVVRLKLQALYGPRLLSSPALASKVLDPVQISLKCYGGSALLESCNSTLHNDTDGDSKVANGGGNSAKKGSEVEDKACKESKVDKLANSICDKMWAKANVARGEKDTGFQGDSVSTQESKKADKNDQWQKVVSNFRSRVLRNKAKAVAGDKSGAPKTEINEDQQSFLDVDLPAAGGEFGISRGPNGSSKDSPITEVFGKSFKQKNSQSQFSHQQESKDTKEALSFLSSLDDITPLNSHMSPDEDTFSTQTEISKNKTALSFTEMDDSSEEGLLWDKKPLQSKDGIPGSVKFKMSKGKDTALPQAAEDGSNAQVWNQLNGKDTTPGMSNFKAKHSDDAAPAQSHGKIPFGMEATSQPSNHNNSIPRTGYMVCVQNLPSSCNPAAIKPIMAKYGEVLGLFKKAVGNECYNVYVEFKTEQSMEATIRARKLQIGSKSFLITRTDQVFSTVVRLSRVSNDTTEKQLLSLCGKYGSIDNIRKCINGIYDVYYQVKELPNMARILESLNEVTLNQTTWLATPAPVVHPSVQKDVLRSLEGQAWHNIQVNQAFNRIQSGMDGMFVLFEDLKELTEFGKEFSKR